jgi:hypothetical protein
MSFSSFPTDDSILNLSWASCFLRSAENYPHRVDRQYLINQRDSSNFFISWFLDDTSLPYMEMLKRQHLLASAGQDGNSLYKVPAPKNKWLQPTSFMNGSVVYHSPNGYRKRTTYPGKLRNELEVLNIPHCTTDILRLEKKERQLLQKTHRKTVLSNSNTQIFEVDFYNLPGITCPVKQIKKYLYQREAPCGKTREELQNACAELMSRIRKMYKGGLHHSCVELLSAYYHTGINLMPFNNINNSLFMAHVNSIALLCGYSVIEHGYLDYCAMLMSHSAFQDLFLFPITVDFKRIASYEQAKNLTEAIYIHETQGNFFYIGKLEKSFFGGNPRHDGVTKKSARYCTGYKHWIDAALQSGSKLYVCVLNEYKNNISIIEETIIRYIFNITSKESILPSDQSPQSHNLLNAKINAPLQKIFLKFKGEVPNILKH